MQLALDPLMHCDRPLPEVVRLVADLGWENLELCSRDDFFPEYWPPRADKTRIREFKQALHQTGMSLVSLLLTYRWASPDEEERQAARPLLETGPPHSQGDRMSDGEHHLRPRTLATVGGIRRTRSPRRGQ